MMNEDVKQTMPALLLALSGLLISAAVAIFLFSQGMTDAKDVVAVAGLFTGITGTLVGTFLGVHMGSIGKARLQADRDHYLRLSEKAMARHSPQVRTEIQESMKS
jgi:hypothetical protein